MKKTPLRKLGKTSLSKIQRQIWEHCKRITRARYEPKCYTCGRNVEGANCHTGHMLPKGALSAYLKYDLRLLRLQCYHCNINLGGNGAIFIENMRKIEGDEYVDGILADRNILVNAMDHYIKILEEYKTL